MNQAPYTEIPTVPMSGLLGNARWSEETGQPLISALDGQQLLFGYPVDLYATILTPLPGRILAGKIDRHLLTIAGTRAGKGVSLIIPNLLTYAGSAIVIDPKGENAWVTAARRRAMGQKTYILDPWDEVNRRYGSAAGETETVARFNPLSILDPASPDFADNVAYLADALIVVRDGNSAHFDESARDLVEGLIAYTVEKPELRAEASLGIVRQYVSQSGTFIRALAEDAAQLGHRSLAARKLSRFTAESKELDSVVNTARTQTAFLDSNTLETNMAASDFSFDELLTGAATIYLVLPVDRLQTYGRWLRLMISIAIRTLARANRPTPLPCLFILDEFGTIGRLNAVVQAFGLMAGAGGGMILWAFVQDLNQLKRDYQNDWETFIGNSQYVSCFGIMDDFTAEHVSKMLGTTTIEYLSTSVQQGPAKGFLFPSAPVTGSSQSQQIMARRLLLPEQVRSLARHLSILIGQSKPFLFAKIIYYDERIFAERARPDPHFGPPKKWDEPPPAVAPKPGLSSTQWKWIGGGFAGLIILIGIVIMMLPTSPDNILYQPEADLINRINDDLVADIQAASRLTDKDCTNTASTGSSPCQLRDTIHTASKQASILNFRKVASSTVSKSNGSTTSFTLYSTYDLNKTFSEAGQQCMIISPDIGVYKSNVSTSSGVSSQLMDVLLSKKALKMLSSQKICITA